MLTKRKVRWEKMLRESIKKLPSEFDNLVFMIFAKTDTET